MLGRRCGSESEAVFGQAFRSERPSGGGLETEASAPVGEAGWSRRRASFLLDQAFRSVIRSPSGLLFRNMGRPMS